MFPLTVRLSPVILFFASSSLRSASGLLFSGKQISVVSASNRRILICYWIMKQNIRHSNSDQNFSRLNFCQSQNDTGNNLKICFTCENIFIEKSNYQQVFIDQEQAFNRRANTCRGSIRYLQSGDPKPRETGMKWGLESNPSRGSVRQSPPKAEALLLSAGLMQTSCAKLFTFKCIFKAHCVSAQRGMSAINIHKYPI